jgi:hypothetical protein
MQYLQLIRSIAYWFHKILVQEIYQIKYNLYLNSSCDTIPTMLSEKSVFYIKPIGSFHNQVNDTGSWEPLVLDIILDQHYHMMIRIATCSYHDNKEKPLSYGHVFSPLIFHIFIISIFFLSQPSINKKHKILI